MRLRTTHAILAIVFLLGLPLSLHADDGGWQELENWAQNYDSGDSQDSSRAPADSLLTTSSSDDLSLESPSDQEISRPAQAPSRIVKPVITSPGAPAAATPVRSRPLPGSLKAPPGFSHVPTVPLNSLQAPAAPAPEMPVKEETQGTDAGVESESPELPLPPPAPVVKRARIVPKPAAEAPPAEKNLFAEEFVLGPDQKLRYKTSENGGYVLVESSGRGGKPVFALVTNFGGGAVRMRQLAGIEDFNTAKKMLKEHTNLENFHGVEIRHLSLPEGESTVDFFWIGHKAFESREKAQAEIASLQAAVEAQGGDFDRMVQEAQTYMAPPEAIAPIHLPSPEQFEKEEKLFLKMLDALDVGEKNFGAFQGEASGEAVTWQSFGETTWRNTNLADNDFNSQVGFWTNRLVVKGIRAPLSTIDPFVEFTAAMESNGVDFANNLKVFAGLEWRPFSQNSFLYNFRPWSLPLLEFVRNYRLYVMYGDRFPLLDEIEASRDNDLIWGVQIFYEWGIDLPAAGEGKPATVPDYLREYVWGEYFGNYRFEKTNFGSEEDFNAFIWNSSVILGVRLPGVPLPPNPINDKLVLMPYVHFEHVNNTEFSFPFQNQYFVGAGIRWMPFRTYRYKENEWLSKVKVFGEYVGIGKVQNAKQDGEAPNAVRTDWRVGISFSSRRF